MSFGVFLRCNFQEDGHLDDQPQKVSMIMCHEIAKHADDPENGLRSFKRQRPESDLLEKRYLHVAENCRIKWDEAAMDNLKRLEDLCVLISPK